MRAIHPQNPCPSVFIRGYQLRERLLNKIPALFAAAAVLISVPLTSSAHPASGIAVTPGGDVLFIYTGHGVCKLDPQGRLAYIHRTRGGHWLCLDPRGSFSHAQPSHFERISPDGLSPAIIFADGGSPVAMLPDGALCYVTGGGDLAPGGLQLARNSPEGDLSLFAPGLKPVTRDRTITGLAAGSDGNLYVACPNAVFKVTKDGAFSTLADPIHLEGCDVDYPDGNTNNLLPYLRGLAVDGKGTVFAAATACHCVVKITASGKVESVVKAARPWSPTGTAEHKGNIYVLEYTHANEGSATGWLPRVRKIARDGTVSTLVTITSDTRIPDPP